MCYQLIIQYPENKEDNFIVGLTNSFNAVTDPPVRGSYPLCGQYPSAAETGALLNCTSTVTEEAIRGKKRRRKIEDMEEEENDSWI